MEAWVELTGTRMDGKVHHFVDDREVIFEHLRPPNWSITTDPVAELLDVQRELLVRTGSYRWHDNDPVEVMVPQSKLAYWYAEFAWT